MASKLFGLLTPPVQCHLEKCIVRSPGDKDHHNWARAAILQLKKKIKEDACPGVLEDLVNALKNPELHSKCIPVSRNKDGRMQVKGVKRYPHFIFCVVWRWPKLESHSLLTEVKECNFPFNKKDLKYVCVNPYHYQLVEHPSPIPSSKVPHPSKGAVPQGTHPRPYQVKQGDEIMDAEETVPAPASHWATIRYFEEGTRVGDSFHCFHKDIAVDGFTDPSNNGARLSLGTLPNPRRSPVTEKTRRVLGNGIVISHLGNNYVIKNVSAFPVFLNSRLSNLHNEDPNPGSVKRLAPGESWTFFDLGAFRSVLHGRASRGSYTEVHDLVNMCSIPVSFVKGWGGEYQRRLISQAPCWIEVALHEPLIWLDEALKVMKPDTFTSSTS